MQYLQTALNMLKEKAYYSQELDLGALEHKIQELAADAQTPEDCYPAIRVVVEALHEIDIHTFFLSPEEKNTRFMGAKPLSFGMHVLSPEMVIVEVFANSPAEQAGLRVGDMVERLNGVPPEPSTDRKLPLDTSAPLHLHLRRDDKTFEATLHAAYLESPALPHGHYLGNGIGYLELFTHATPNLDQTYINTTQQIIREVSVEGAKGWIVDLRCNRGGNMWPMITGAGPLMGEGLLGQFIHRNRDGMKWFYRAGFSVYLDPDESEPVNYMKATDPVPAFDPETTPVAVLTSEFTGSSGEMTLISFLGRPKTRTFGEKTHGQITGVAMYPLEDGALLGIAENITADRTGKRYTEAISPDEPISIDWFRYGKPDDPVITAAVEWLHTQQ